MPAPFHLQARITDLFPRSRDGALDGLCHYRLLHPLVAAMTSARVSLCAFSARGTSRTNATVGFPRLGRAARTRDGNATPTLETRRETGERHVLSTCRPQPTSAVSSTTTTAHSLTPPRRCLYQNTPSEPSKSRGLGLIWASTVVSANSACGVGRQTSAAPRFRIQRPSSALQRDCRSQHLTDLTHLLDRIGNRAVLRLLSVVSRVPDRHLIGLTAPSFTDHSTFEGPRLQETPNLDIP
jgi:hypothetical protein